MDLRYISSGLFGTMTDPAPSQPDSLDSIFIDDDHDAEAEAIDDGSFTMIDDYDLSHHSPLPQPDIDARQHLSRKKPSHEPNTTEKMKSKIISFWHNVKYGWTVKPKSGFSKKKPIFLLSNCYDFSGDEMTHQMLEKTLIEFKKDFTSRIWLTYRQGFPPITDTQMTSDSGWGCMIRTGQMVLAQAFVVHFLGRNWNMFSEQSHDKDVMHREIISWFFDIPSQNSPFSVHRLVNIGKSLGRKAGDWYGPATVATILEKACQISPDFKPILRDICLYVAHDCTIYKQDVIDLASGGLGSTDSSLGESWKSLIILVPVRLGTEALNSIYVPCLKGLFAIESFLGIIGGKPKHSLYFVGFQSSKLIHLDPHLLQDAVGISSRDFDIESYHCAFPHKLSFSNMDPSCALGFYCRTEKDFNNFTKIVQPYLIPPGVTHGYPMFVINDGSRKQHLYNNL